jgi:hypothetical protein
MSFSQTLIQTLPLADALRGLFVAALLLGTMMMFRPLLTGIGRAIVLAFRQRVTARKELAQRRSLHEARTLAARG